MNISARNKMFGNVTKLTTGVVNTEVVITKASAKTLKLKQGAPVVAIIKSSDILLAVPCGNPECKCGQ